MGNKVQILDGVQKDKLYIIYLIVVFNDYQVQAQASLIC